MKAFLNKHREFILYGLCGVPTVAANLGCYFVLAAMNTPTVLCSLIATVISIIVAYFTNKIWVFHTRCGSKRDAVREFTAFFSCRILTGISEAVILVVFIDLLRLTKYEAFIKLCATVFVVAVNYFASKRFIFKDEN